MLVLFQGSDASSEKFFSAAAVKGRVISYSVLLSQYNSVEIENSGMDVSEDNVAVLLLVWHCCGQTSFFCYLLV